MSRILAARIVGRAIALDGGTSTTRARLVEDGRVVAVATRSVGVRDVVLSGGVGGLSPVAEAVRACLDELGVTAPIVAAGMLSSEVGLTRVAHVEAPAGLAELARGATARAIPEVADAPILFIPGVRTPPGPGPEGWLDADLMRGEESETIGARLILGVNGPAAFLWPGSHAKLVAVDEAGRIARSTTLLSGEIAATIARGTLIAASLPGGLPERPDPEAVALGMRVGAEQGIGRSAFLVRVADTLGALGPDARASFWVGAVVGDDAVHLARHPILAGGMPLTVGGREPLRSLYARAIGARGVGPVRVLDDEEAGLASAIGALAVAAEAGWGGISSR